MIDLHLKHWVRVVRGKINIGAIKSMDHNIHPALHHNSSGPFPNVVLHSYGALMFTSTTGNNISLMQFSATQIAFEITSV